MADMAQRKGAHDHRGACGDIGSVSWQIRRMHDRPQLHRQRTDRSELRSTSNNIAGRSTGVGDSTADGIHPGKFV